MTTFFMDYLMESQYFMKNTSQLRATFILFVLYSDRIS